MTEWKNPYNSFNSYKGLLYRDHFDCIKQGIFLPPVEVNIDPVNNCSLKCVWCNGKKIIDREKSVMMSTEHLIEMAYFLWEWGVKAVCFAGGGESLMHPELGVIFKLYKSLKLESAIITNGLFMNDQQMTDIAECARWIGISVDASTPETYQKCKGWDEFDRVMDNARKLIALNPKEVTFKFLIHPFNQTEILDACKLAKETGFHRFHTRIISKRYLNGNSFDYENIKRQLEECQKLNEDKFQVFTISHKQDGEDNRRICFDKCRVSPLLCMMEADGTVGVCIDRKGDPETTLCRHDNLEDVRAIWGSEYHKQLLEKINVTKCPKCTLNIYQELYNEYCKDSFCVNFP